MSFNPSCHGGGGLVVSQAFPQPHRRFPSPPQDPWKAQYQMYSYVTKELPAVIAAQFPQILTGLSLPYVGPGELPERVFCLPRDRASSLTPADVCCDLAHASPNQQHWGRNRCLRGILDAQCVRCIEK